MPHSTSRRRFAGCAVFLYFFVFAGFAGGQEQPRQDLLDEALALDKDGFLDEAAVAWEQLAKTGASDKVQIAARLKLSSAYFKLGEFHKAVQAAKQVTTAFPDNFFGQFHLGNALSGMRRFQEALAAYEKAVELRPNEGLGYVGLALSLYGNQAPDQAIGILRTAKAIFKKKRNISWHRDMRIMMQQIKGFEIYPPNFSDLWLANNLKLVRETYEKTLFDVKKLLK